MPHGCKTARIDRSKTPTTHLPQRQRNGLQPSLRTAAPHTEPAVLWWTTMRRCLALTVVAQAAAYSGRTAPGRLAWVDRYLLLASSASSPTTSPRPLGVLRHRAGRRRDDDAGARRGAATGRRRAARSRVRGRRKSMRWCARGVCAPPASWCARRMAASPPLKWWDEVCVGVRALNAPGTGAVITPRLIEAIEQRGLGERRHCSRISNCRAPSRRRSGTIAALLSRTRVPARGRRVRRRARSEANGRRGIAARERAALHC